MSGIKGVLLGAAILIATLVLLKVLGAQTAVEAPKCIYDEERVLIRSLTVEAIDAAFKDQVHHLFEIWMKDPKDQPERAKSGMQNAINAHLRARKDALAWLPPRC